MAAKRSVLACVAAALALAAVGAQTSADSGGASPADATDQAAPVVAATYYFTLGADGQPIFTQVLSWDEDPNALEYQVVVRDSTGADFLDERTPEAKKELHLAPGSYTYKVVTYNLLGKPDVETDWIPFSIIKAEQPKLSGSSPTAIYMDSLDGRVTITGDNLLPDGVASLVPANGKPPSEGKVVKRKETQEIVVLFPEKAYEKGDYSLTFTNPGGLSSTIDRALRIRFQRPVDLLVSLGYSPFASLGNAWSNATWSPGFKPIGLDAGIDLFFVKQRWGFLGLEAAAQWRRMYGGEETAKLTSDFLLAGMNALYKYRFSRQLHALVRVGGGLAWSYHSFDYEGFAGPSASSFDPFGQAGIALQAFLPNKLYGEIGADFSYIFLVGNYTFGIAPRLLVGYQLY